MQDALDELFDIWVTALHLIGNSVRKTDHLKQLLGLASQNESDITYTTTFLVYSSLYNPSVGKTDHLKQLLGLASEIE